MQSNSYDSIAIKNKEKYIEYIKKNNYELGLDRYCNICGYRFAQFNTFNGRENASCPVCGSVERHRHLAVHLFALLPFLQGKKILHFAPEAIIKNILMSSYAEYYDADIVQWKATYCIDITKISFEDAFFDYVLAIHVLEHIVDDALALRNIFRVLKPGGVAILSVPIFQQFFEQPEAVTPEERLTLYGQADHVRKYDYNTFFTRLKETGFLLKISRVQDFPNFFRKEINLGDSIFFAEKPR